MILVGLTGSGKTTAGQILEEVGFWRVSSGDVIREMCADAGLTTDRRTLQEFGYTLLQERGAEWYIDQLLRRTCDHSWCAIEGLRSKRGAELLVRSAPRAALVYLESDDATREARVCARDGIPPDVFRMIDRAPIEGEAIATKSIADFILQNNAGPAALRDRILMLAAMIRAVANSRLRL